MADCINEITGVQSISLYTSNSVRLVRPDISNENEVNLISDGEDSYIISDPVLLPKWERVVGYSGNYKQNYLDEFTFLAFGIENEIPAIIKELRNTRVGYVVEIKTIGDSNYVFQSPVFLNNANTKRIDSHSWQISLSYRIPSFLDKLTNLETILGTESEVLPCDNEIQGVKSISLYDNFVSVDGVLNENIDYNYPDLSNENEVDVIVLEDAFLVIDQVKEQPKWERIINYSENYKQNYNDEFTFLLHGIENEVPETIKTLRNNRLGYIAVITTTSNKTYIFPTPIFLNEDNTKQVDSHSWSVSLSYRVPSFDDKLSLLSINIFVEGIDIILDMSTPSTAGFNLTFASGSLFMDWDDGGGLVPFVSGVELLKTYTIPGTKNIKISGDRENITKFIADNSKIIFIENLKTGLLTNFTINNNLYVGALDMSNAPVGIRFWTYSNSGLTSITFASSGNSLITDFRVYLCDITGTLDLSNNPVGGRFECRSNSGLTAITFASSGNAKFTLTRMYSCNLTGVLDLSNNPVGGTVQIYSNPNLTGITFSSTGNTIILNFDLHSNDLTGTLDLSNVPVGTTVQIFSNAGATGITFASSGNGNIFGFILISSAYNYIDFTNLSFSINNGNLRLENNSMAVADVNHILVDLYSLVSGESGGGDFTGRTIRIDGTNAAPDGSSGGFDGAQAVIDLTAKGINVIVTP